MLISIKYRSGNKYIEFDLQTIYSTNSDSQPEGCNPLGNRQLISWRHEQKYIVCVY